MLLSASAYLLMKCLKGASSLPSSSSVTMSSLSTLAHRELFRDSRDDTEIFRCAILLLLRCDAMSADSPCDNSLKLEVTPRITCLYRHR